MMRKFLSVVLVTAASAWAHEVPVLDEVRQLPPVVVTGRADPLIGFAESATVGTVGAEQLEQRPILRPGELLETVPGVIITQHSGAGKANQFFLRGFNLDHGTDFSTTLDGMPVNLPTHGHGQGYTDLNFIIPELVERIDFKKGPYYADKGDFASAGAVDIAYANYLPAGLALVEAGNFGFVRGVVAASPHLGDGHLLYGLELFHDDGPWRHPDDFKKANAVVRYSEGDDNFGFSVTAMGYYGDWDATDQIARRALRMPGFGRFDSLDATTGGDSQRGSLSGEWHSGGTKISAYTYYYHLDLFSNFTYFLDDPVNGDQFEQSDRRWVSGVNASHQWTTPLFDRDLENTLGFQFRADDIENGLFKTQARDRLSTTRRDDVLQTSFGFYGQSKAQWFEKFRSTLGVRGDVYRFDVDSDNSVNSGHSSDAIASPKLSLVFGPWANTEFYLNGGFGFHSNDGRGTTTTIDPGSGTPVRPVDALVRTKGAEVGVRTLALPKLQSTLALWVLDIDSELLFVGDAGTTEPSRPSRRYGVEFANYYTPTKWLTLDADFAWSHARFTDHDPAGDHIPGSIQSVIAAGITFHDLHGFFGSLRVRYFGPRSLIEDDSVRSASTTLLYADAGYRINKTWTVAVEAFNLLNTKASDIDYFYTSRLPGEPAAGVDDVHFHPALPFHIRGRVTARF